MAATLPPFRPPPRVVNHEANIKMLREFRYESMKNLRAGLAVEGPVYYGHSLYFAHGSTYLFDRPYLSLGYRVTETTLKLEGALRFPTLEAAYTYLIMQEVER